MWENWNGVLHESENIQKAFQEANLNEWVSKLYLAALWSLTHTDNWYLLSFSVNLWESAEAELLFAQNKYEAELNSRILEWFEYAVWLWGRLHWIPPKHLL